MMCIWSYANDIEGGLKMKEKICKNCGKTVDKKAVVCTSCGVKIKKSLLKKWWFWIVVIFIIITAIGVSKDTDNTIEIPTAELNADYNNIETSDNENKNTTSEQLAPKKNSPKISKAEFESLKTGMTYNEVVSIIGSEGEMSSQVDVAGYDTKLYIWEGEGSIGANANVTFQNNKLVSKAQIGLK